MQPALTGQQLGPYMIHHRLGEGGMATVYRASHTVMGWDVALKVLNPSLTGDADFVERFQREARILDQMRHPNIVQVRDAAWQDGYFYIAMEYLDGESLDVTLERVGRLSPAQVIGLGAQVADALAFAHTRFRLIHRDIKPGNLMLLRDGQTVKVLDFGVAALLSGRRSAATQIGTPEYMPYEQMRGQADERSDVYALGASLYQLLTGQLPSPFGVEPPIPPQRLNPQVSPALGQVILRALQRDPAARFQSAAELGRALQAARTPARPVSPARPGAVTRIKTPQPPAPYRPREPRRTQMYLLPLAVTAVLVIVLIGAIALVALPWVLGLRPTPTVGTTVAPTASPMPTHAVLPGSMPGQIRPIQPAAGADYVLGQTPESLTWSAHLGEEQTFKLTFDGTEYVLKDLQLSETGVYTYQHPSLKLDAPGIHEWKVEIVDKDGKVVVKPERTWFFVVQKPTPTPEPPTAAPTLTPTPTSLPTSTSACTGGQVLIGTECKCPPDKPDWLNGQCNPKSPGGGETLPTPLRGRP